MPAATKAHNADQPYRVLAVDDDPASTELTRIALESLSPANFYVVREVNQSQAAVAAAEEFAPDLIIMDVDMPRLDGRAAALLIQCKKGLSDVPILFVTSMIPETSGANAFGWHGPLAKPVSPRLLVSTVESILRNRVSHCVAS